MFMQIFHALLLLYPPEHKKMFAPEMLALLEERTREKRQRGWSAPVRFIVTESFGLLKGAAAEWIAKLTQGSYITNQRLPGQTGCEASLPADVVKAQRLVQSILHQMEHAIANHQFEKARFYSYAEQKARKRLRLLQQKHKLVQ